MNERILIIDDETNIRLMIKLALNASGYQTEVASDGREGLEKFGDGEGIDLVLLDQRMPGMPGIEVQREIYRRRPGARLILITAFGTIDTALEAVKAGASDFIRKPFTADTLRSAVRTALDRPTRDASEGVPVGMVCREFTRKTINGYAFERAHGSVPAEHGVAVDFEVSHNAEPSENVRVVLPPYVQEHALALADLEVVPGGHRFWEAMCEEALANYLWQNVDLPPGKRLEVDDLSPSLQAWLRSVTTVTMGADVR